MADRHDSNKKYYTKDQNIFFTSDLHWFHENGMRYDKRPFENMNHMIDTMTANWNSVVGENDIVFNLGDFVLAKKNQRDLYREKVSKLNGRHILVRGNHDSNDILDSMEDILHEIHTPYHELYLDNVKIVLCHYPILVWNKHHKDAIHLHAHCHGSLEEPGYYDRKVIDVGCMLHDYTPISWEKVKEIMVERGFTKLDNHG